MNFTEQQLRTLIRDLHVSEELQKIETDCHSKRKAEYPSLVDQMDKIYHSGIDAWKADIKAIKDKYPKP